MKKLGFILVLVLILASLAIAACGGSDEEEASPTATTPPAATEAPADTEAPTQPSGELSNILGCMADIRSIKYDMIVTDPHMEQMTSTVWLKIQKGMRVESTFQETLNIMIIDFDKQIMYNYMPAQNMAYKTDFSDAPESPLEGVEYLEQYNPVITGTEKRDGKECWVLEYTEDDSATKVWVWKDKCFPIREERTTPQGTSIVEYRNIDFSTISDSMFQLPAGVEIIDMSSGFDFE